MQYEIKHIHEELGVTIVYVTHDQSEALTMSNRIAVFNDGVIQQLASPSALYEKPENAFVAQFIGENNRLCGKINAVEGNHCQVDLGWWWHCSSPQCEDRGGGRTHDPLAPP